MQSDLSLVIWPGITKGPGKSINFTSLRSASINEIYSQDRVYLLIQLLLGPHKSNAKMGFVNYEVKNLAMEQRINIKFCVKLEKSPAETHEMLLTAYGNDALTKQQTNVWYKRFEDGREDVEDDHRTGRPKVTYSPELAEKVNKIFARDPQITLKMMASELSVSRRSISVAYCALKKEERRKIREERIAKKNAKRGLEEKGLVISFTNVKEGTNSDNIKEAFDQFAPVIRVVFTEGDTQGSVIFKYEHQTEAVMQNENCNGKVLVNGAEVSTRILEGDDDDAFWLKNKNLLQCNRQPQGGFRGRGSFRRSRGWIGGGRSYNNKGGRKGPQKASEKVSDTDDDDDDDDEDDTSEEGDVPEEVPVKIVPEPVKKVPPPKKVKTNPKEEARLAYSLIQRSFFHTNAHMPDM